MEQAVECRSEVEYAERPVALAWQSQRLAVKQVIAQWRTPEGSYFRVLTAGDLIFDLCYSQAEDAWKITQTG